jgi:DNA-binding CsgD family transcriptional regulator
MPDNLTFNLLGPLQITLSGTSVALRAAQVVRVLAAAQKVRDLLSLRRTPREAAEHAALVDKLKTKMDKSEYDQAWSAGCDLPNEQALIEALGPLNATELAPVPQPAALGPRLRPVQPAAPGIELSEWEREVLALAAEGLSNQDIAARLFIAERTVRFHIITVFNKLGASNRAQAVAIAARQGLV